MSTESNMYPFSDAQFVKLYNYKKFDSPHDTGDQTGSAILLNMLQKPVAVIDIDFSMSEEDKQTFFERLKTVLPSDTVVVQTAHKGLHIYCIHNLYLKMTRYVKIVKTDEYDIDFFIAGTPNKKSALVCPETRVIDKDTGAELRYVFAMNDFGTSSLPNLDQILDALGKVTDVQPLRNWVDRYRNPPPPPPPHVDPVWVNRDFADKVVSCIADMIIDDSDEPIEKCLTLKYLFPALNALSDVRNVEQGDIDRYYQEIHNQNSLTETAKNNWEGLRSAMASEKSTWGHVVKILKLHKKDIYNDQILPFCKGRK